MPKWLIVITILAGIYEGAVLIALLCELYSCSRKWKLLVDLIPFAGIIRLIIIRFMEI